MRRRPSRRALFGSAALLATLPAMARAHGPDRDLVAVCGAFIVLRDRMDTLWASDLGEEQVQHDCAPIDRAQAYCLDRMARLRASTADGIQARALALCRLAHDDKFTLHDPETTTGRLLAYLLRDAAALGGAR